VEPADFIRQTRACALDRLEIGNVQLVRDDSEPFTKDSVASFDSLLFVARAEHDDESELPELPANLDTPAAIRTRHERDAGRSRLAASSRHLSSVAPEARQCLVGGLTALAAVHR